MKRMLPILTVLMAMACACAAAGPSFPINNGVLQSALNAAGKDITNANTLAATNVLVGGVPVMTTNSPVTTNNLPGLLPQLADGNGNGASLTNLGGVTTTHLDAGGGVLTADENGVNIGGAGVYVDTQATFTAGDTTWFQYDVIVGDGTNDPSITLGRDGTIAALELVPKTGDWLDIPYSRGTSLQLTNPSFGGELTVIDENNRTTLRAAGQSVWATNGPVYMTTLNVSNVNASAGRLTNTLLLDNMTYTISNRSLVASDYGDPKIVLRWASNGVEVAGDLNVTLGSTVSTNFTGAAAFTNLSATTANLSNATLYAANGVETISDRTLVAEEYSGDPISVLTWSEGAVNVFGTVTATAFSGSGAGLTNVVPYPWINVERFGVTNAFLATGLSANSGSPSVYSTNTSLFTADMVGKKLRLDHCGVYSGTPWPRSTYATITQVVSGSQCKIDTLIQTTITNGNATGIIGDDMGPAISELIAANVISNQWSNLNPVFYFPSDHYIVSQILIPNVDISTGGAGPTKSMTLKGKAGGVANYSYGVPAQLDQYHRFSSMPGQTMFWGTTTDGSSEMLTATNPTLTFINVQLEDLCFRMVPNPVSNCINAYSFGNFAARNLRVDTNMRQPYSTGAEPTASASCGIVFPKISNWGPASQIIQNVIVSGFYTGAKMIEHVHAFDIAFAGCKRGIVFPAEALGHNNNIIGVDFEGCPTGIRWEGVGSANVFGVTFEHSYEPTNAWYASTNGYDLDDSLGRSRSAVHGLRAANAGYRIAGGSNMLIQVNRSNSMNNGPPELLMPNGRFAIGNLTNTVKWGQSWDRIAEPSAIAAAYCGKLGVTDLAVRQRISTSVAAAGTKASNLVDFAFFYAGANLPGGWNFPTYGSTNLQLIGSTNGPCEQLPGGITIPFAALTTVLPQHGPNRTVLVWWHGHTNSATNGVLWEMAEDVAWPGNFARCDDWFITINSNAVSHTVNIGSAQGLASGIMMLSASVFGGDTNFFVRRRLQDGMLVSTNGSGTLTNSKTFRFTIGADRRYATSPKPKLNGVLVGYMIFDAALTTNEIAAIDAAVKLSIPACAVVGDSINASQTAWPLAATTNRALMGAMEFTNTAISGSRLDTGTDNAWYQITNKVVPAFASLSPGRMKIVALTSAHNDMGTNNIAAVADAWTNIVYRVRSSNWVTVAAVPYLTGTQTALTNAHATYIGRVRSAPNVDALVDLHKNFYLTVGGGTNLLYGTNTSYFYDTPTPVHPINALVQTNMGPLYAARLAQFVGGQQWATPGVTVNAPQTNNGTLTVNSNLVLGSIGSGGATTTTAQGASISTGGTNLMFVLQDGAGIKFTNRVGKVNVNLQTGTSYTLAAGDQYVRCTNAAATLVTVPTLASVPSFDVGYRLDIIQVGAGQVTITNAVGVTLNYSETLKLRSRWSAATLTKVADDIWDVTGDFEAAP